MWKCYINNYYVSDKGQIKNNATGKILKLRCDQRGYKKTNISINGKLYTVFPHRLVALLFIPNPENKPMVNHIDGNKQNNDVNNLEWVTARENTQHAHKIGLISHETTSKKISQYTLDDIYIKTFKSMREAAREVYGNENLNSSIWKCANGERSSCKGYKWKYYQTH